MLMAGGRRSREKNYRELQLRHAPTCTDRPPEQKTITTHQSRITDHGSRITNHGDHQSTITKHARGLKPFTRHPWTSHPSTFVKFNQTRISIIKTRQHRQMMMLETLGCSTSVAMWCGGAGDEENHHRANDRSHLQLASCVKAIDQAMHLCFIQ